MGEPHPEWGPCDGFGPNGECSECTGKVAGEVERDLMGDPGPAEAMVLSRAMQGIGPTYGELAKAFGPAEAMARRAVEEEREAAAKWLRTYATEFRKRDMTPDAVAVFAYFAAEHIETLAVPESEALPATPAPETCFACRGSGMDGPPGPDANGEGAARCDVCDGTGELDAAPGPSAEDALRWPKADDDDAAKGWTYDPSWLARVADAVDRVPDGEDRPSLEVVENVLRALAHLATGEGQANG